MVVAQVALRVDQIFSRPIAVRICAPDGIAAVQYDRIIETELRDRLENVSAVARETEFRRMHPYYDQAFCGVAAMPFRHVGQGANTIDAGVIPEIEQNNFAPAQLRQLDRSL